MKKIFLCILIIIVVSCGHETEYRYYPTGEIAEKKVFFQKGDTSSYLLTEYYLNKQMKCKGNVINSLREGVWHKWYADGDWLWAGEYYKNERVLPDTIGYPKYLFSDSLIVGKSTYVRVALFGIYRRDLTVLCTNASILIAEDNLDLYDYVIVPRKSGFMSFATFREKEGEEIMEMLVDSFYVYPNKNEVLLE